MEKSGLRKFILTEFSKMDLKGMMVTDFSIEGPAIKLVVELEKSVVAFSMKENGKFQILSVIHRGKKYVDKSDLDRFGHFIKDVTQYLRPLVREKIEAYTQLRNTIEYREKQVKSREEQVEKRRLTLDAREQLLKFQTEAIDFEHQTLEADKLRNESQKVRKWGRENDFLLKWLIIGAVILLVIAFVILIR